MERNEFRRLTEANNGKRPYFDEFRSRCSLLVDERCTHYEIRPSICRLWGLVKDTLECPFGCVPERWLTNEEAKRFSEKVEKAAGRKGPETTLSKEHFLERYGRPLS
jgi:Fe-S-cluster containining protein